MTLRVFEAFAGVGSQRMALRNLGIDHEVVAIAEIDKFALQSYQAIHGDCPNLGDISTLTLDQIPDHDLFTYSFPCQDISVSGKQKGLEKGSGTRSGLLWECERIIEGKRPKFLLLENVKNLIGKNHRSQFDLWLKRLEELGYTNYWKVLNAKHYGVPQNRERVFVVSILGTHTPYTFPAPIPLTRCIRDILEEEVDEKYYLNRPFKLVDKGHQAEFLNEKFEQNARIYGESQVMRTLGACDRGQYNILIEPQLNQVAQLEGIAYEQTARVYDPDGLCSTINTCGGGMVQPKILLESSKSDELVFVGGIEGKDWAGDGKSYSRNFSQGKRIYGSEGIACTQTAQSSGLGGHTGLYQLDETEHYRVRKLTPKECWRLMGFSDEDFERVQAIGMSNAQLYKQAGNSIVVPCLEGIFSQLFRPIKPLEVAVSEVFL